MVASTDPEDDDEHGEWYLRRHLRQGFRFHYYGRGLVCVKHMTIADSEDYSPKVRQLAVIREMRDAGYPLDYYANRYTSWTLSVRGRTWSAVRPDGWNKRDFRRSDFPECEYEDLRRLEGNDSVYKERGEKIDHIADLSTLTLFPREF